MSRRTVGLLAALAVGALLGACTEDDSSAEELCEAVEAGDLSGTFQDFDPTDPEAALDQLRTARVQLGDLLDAAPAEVRDDLEVEIDYVQALIDALEGVEPGDAAESALQVQSVTDAHPDVRAAAAKLEAFAASEC